jgi:hypothetical protein
MTSCKRKLKATNAIMALVHNPNFNPSELGTERVKTQGRALLRGHDEDDVRNAIFTEMVMP